MNKLAAILVLLGSGVIGTAGAQSQPQGPPAPRSYEFKNLDVNRANSVLTLVQALVPSIQITYVRELNTVALRCANQADLDKAEELVKKYDVPRAQRPKVKFTAYLIEARRPADARFNGRGSLAPNLVGIPQPAGNPVPPELQSVIGEMKRTFAYDAYSLLDVIETEAQGGGSASYEGTLPGSSMAKPDFYTLAYESVNIGADKAILTVSPFEFSLKIPYGTAAAPGYGVNRIRTDITIHDGQKLVLGKVGLKPGSNADLFLVLTAKVE
jgi:hypothetical protein